MKRAEGIITLLIVIIFISSFTGIFYKMADGDQSSSASTKDWRTMWLEWASIAWRYFQPGIGVNPKTGLHYGAGGTLLQNNLWHDFTDWDLATYIWAILDAEGIGLISSTGDWGAGYRLDKVLTFLETRRLTSDNKPYWAYAADTGEPAATDPTHPSDAGNLLIALDEVRTTHPKLNSTVTTIIQRYNFTDLALNSYFNGNGFYKHYAAQGFNAFGIPTPNLKNISDLVEDNLVDVYGEKLPKALLTAEPLVLTILDGRPNQIFEEVSYNVFKAQEKRYEYTGKLTAFSEGCYPTTSAYYIYEYVVTPSGETWKSIDFISGEDVEPVVFTKIAFAYYALYPSDYSKKLVDYVSDLETPEGFYEGHLESGEVVRFLTDKTNSMILQAARYALQNLVNLNLNTEYNSPNVLESHVSLTRNSTGMSNITISCGVYFPNATAFANLSNKTDSSGATTFNISLPEKAPSGNYTIYIQALSISNSTVIQVINSKNPNAQTNDATNILTIIASLVFIASMGTIAFIWIKKKHKPTIDRH